MDTKISLLISKEIEKFIEEKSPMYAQSWSPECFIKFGALPVMMDGGGVFGLRPDGQVVSTSWDDPDQMQIESEPRIINIVHFKASQKFPSLKSLAPERTEHCKTCPHCNGSRRYPSFGGTIVCYCGGVGWLPE
jgi:hypothetical protein